MAEGPSFHAENSFFQETLETGGHLGDFKHSHSYFLKSSNANKEGEHAGFGSGFLRTASFDHRKGVTGYVDGRDFCELNLFACGSTRISLFLTCGSKTEKMYLLNVFV